MFEESHLNTGLAAGVATSALWTLTSLCFTAAGKRIGPTVVNALRLLLAIVLLGITHRALSGAWVPDVNGRQVMYLALSGVVGLAIGDQALFTAFVDIGPRTAMLIMTTSPLVAALLGWTVLGETLRGIAWVGVAMTLGGVAWVVAERPAATVLQAYPRRFRGVILAFVAAACQAGGLLLSKQGMGHGWMAQEQHLDPQAATLVRMVFAAVAMLPVILLHWRRKRGSGVSRFKAGVLRTGLTYTVMGSVVGPFLGVWMSLVATDRAPLGVAQTLCSLSPILLLPIVAVFHKERITGRAVIGAVIAVLGAALLFVR